MTMHSSIIMQTIKIPPPPHITLMSWYMYPNMVIVLQKQQHGICKQCSTITSAVTIHQIIWYASRSDYISSHTIYYTHLSCAYMSRMRL